MTTFLLRRVLWMIPTLAAMVTLVTFIIMRHAGGPWDVDADRPPGGCGHRSR